MKIIYFHRKVIPNFHFSVEIIFNDVRKYLPSEAEYEIVTSKYFSQGLFPRIYNGLQAFFRKGKINHVTGDINYISVFLPSRRTIHTILDCVYMQQEHSGLKKAIYRYFWIYLPAKRSRFVTTISDASKQEIVKFSGCDPDKVVVIPIALSSIFRKVERSYQWSKPRILLVGAAPNKNLPRVLEALRGLNCFIDMVGKFNEEIMDILVRNKMEHTYEWGLDQQQMAEKYKQTDILLFASTYEGFGMPIIEAQAMGVAVVTSNLSPMTDVGGKGAALYVDPFDIVSIRAGVDSLIRDQSLRDQLIEKGYANVKRFDPATLSNMYLELYRKI